MTDQQKEQIRRDAKEACPHKATYGLIDKMTRGTWIAGYTARAEKEVDRQEAMHYANLKAYEKTMVEMDRLRETLEEIKSTLKASNMYCENGQWKIALNGTEEAHDD